MPDWTFHLGAWTLGATGMLVAACALFWDRARGRLRCPRCWYDAVGAIGPHCPECGHRARSQRDLMRTRRRWRVAMAGSVATLLSWVVHEWPHAQRESWPSVLPGFLLALAPVEFPWIHVAEKRPGWRSRVRDVLQDRGRYGQLGRADVRILLARARASWKAEGLWEPREVVRRTGALFTMRVTSWPGSLEEFEAEVRHRTGLSLRVEVRHRDDSWWPLASPGPRWRGTLAEVLDRYCSWPSECRSPDHPAWTARAGEVVVTTWERLPDYRRWQTYDVRDLTPTWPRRYAGFYCFPPPDHVLRNQPIREADPAPEQLADLIQGAVAMESWVDNGGDVGIVHVFGRRLMICTTDRIHRDVAELLRILRDPAPAPDHLWAITAMEKLRRARLTNAGGRQSLAVLARQLERASGLPVDLDMPLVWDGSLECDAWCYVREGMPSCLEVLDSLVMSNQPVRWGLADRRIVLTTDQGEGAFRIVLAHDLGPFLPARRVETPTTREAPTSCLREDPYDWQRDREERLNDVRELMQSTVDPERWIDHGGDLSRAWIFGDAMVVRTTLRNHLEIESLLEVLRDRLRRSQN